MAVGVLLVAPLCRDEIVTPGATRLRAGGAALYASWALARRGAQVFLHTPLASLDRDLLDALPPSVAVTIHPTRETTRFRIALDPRRPNERVLTLLAASDPPDSARLDVDARADRAAHLLFGPLLPTDLDPPLASWLAAASLPIDLGVQGLVREAGIGAAVHLRRLEVLGFPLRVLAGDEEEIARVAPAIRDGAGEVLITRGDRGAVVMPRGAGPVEVGAVPFRGEARHPVGLGDTFLSVYGWQRSLSRTPRTAGEEAAAAATELLEKGLSA